MKTYEVEIMGTTYRTYFIDAESADDADIGHWMKLMLIGKFRKCGNLMQKLVL